MKIGYHTQQVAPQMPAHSNFGEPMVIQSRTTARRLASSPLLRTSTDRRRHRRVSVTLLGRFMRADRSEYPCKLLDISVGGAAIIAPVAVSLEEKIVLYLDHLGGLEGVVARTFDGGFAIKLGATQHKREKLAAQLTWLLNRHELTGVGERRHDRMVPRTATSTLTLTQGITVACQILDFSISGASIGTPARPPIGHEVQIGSKLKARVVRHHPQGIGVQFLDVQNPAILSKYFA